MAAATTKSASKSPAAAVKTQAKASSNKKDKTSTKETKKSNSSSNKLNANSSESIIKTSIQTSKDKIDASQLKRAIDALLQHESKKQDDNAAKELIESDVPVQIQIGLLKAPGYASPKPCRILLPHAIRTADDEAPEVCLIVKDSSKEWLQELLPHFPSHLSCIKKILTLTSLRTKHHSFAQKRALASKYSHFLADDRILPMLPAALGKEFYRHNKLVPVNITRKEALPFTIQRAMQATHLKLSKGTCLTVAIGTTKHANSDLAENALAAISQCVEHVPQQWKNILSLCLKTPRSMALPFYNQLPEQLLDVSTLRSEEEIQAELKAKQAEEAKKKKEQAVVKKEKRSLADEKSPLLRALKKQKAAEESKKQAETKATTIKDKATKKVVAKETTSTKASKETAKATKTKESLTKKAPEKTAEKPTKSDTSKKTAVAKEAESAKSTPASKASKPKETTSSTKKTPPPKEAESVTKKKSKATPEVSTATKSSSPVASPSGPFMASKKFSGSKAGYVFKKGPQGLGYYKDQPPVVDRMAMEALLRSAKQGQRGGGGNKRKPAGGGFKGKSKGQQRGRR